MSDNDTRYGRDWPAISHLDYWKDKKIDEDTYFILKDFKNFLFVTWGYLGLPAPTPIQYKVADYLQGNRSYIDLSKSDIAVEDLTGDENGAGSIICAYRGFGKSWITGAYCAWLLLRIPHIEIIVASANEEKCTLFLSFVISLLKQIPFLNHLLPDSTCISNKTQMNTPQHRPSQSNSLSAIPIMSSALTGKRADVVIGDDLEVPNNSTSMLKRDRLAERVSEFEAVMGDIPRDGKVKFKQKVLLGTPQTQETLYMRLIKKHGYEMRIWPSRFPNEEQLQRIGHLLCPHLRGKIERNEVYITGYGIRSDMGEGTDTRFADGDLIKKEKGYGYTGYQLQYQLDPSLSDMARFPLKLSDLIVADINPMIGYNFMQWSSDNRDVINELPNYGFSGDYFKRPVQMQSQMSKYEKSVMCIDPSSGGAGNDETTYCIAKSLNGMIFIFEVGGFIEGPQSQSTMDGLASLAKKYEVNEIVIESNQGLGMFKALLQPALQRAKYMCAIEDYRAVGQKEPRMIRVLEPVMNNHRLIFDRNFIANEKLPEIDGMSDEYRQQYSLFYQMTHLEIEKDCLPKDDRIDVLHMAVFQFIEDIDRDVNIENTKKEIANIEAFMNAPSCFETNHGRSMVSLIKSGELHDYSDYFDDSSSFGDLSTLDDFD